MDTRSLIRRYYAAVADLHSTEEDLLPMLAEDFRVVEHPSAASPRGAVRDLAATLDGFRAGKALLREQSFDVHEILVDGDRVAVRATWHGVVGVDAGPYRRGQEVRAHTAALLTVREGLIRHQEIFDCFEPDGLER